jgi:hypothetical protein
VSWTGPRQLRVSLSEPSLDWILSVHTSPVLAVLNTLSAAMPLATWRPTSLRRGRERMAQALGMGRLALSGAMPSGHVGTLMPQRMYYVDEAQATLNGLDLGRPTRLNGNPKIGDLPLSPRGVLFIGMACGRSATPKSSAVPVTQ